MNQIWLVGWLVLLGLYDPLRQYFSLYRVVPQREEERIEKRKMREKTSKQPPPAPTASAIARWGIVTFYTYIRTERVRKLIVIS